MLLPLDSLLNLLNYVTMQILLGHGHNKVWLSADERIPPIYFNENGAGVLSILPFVDLLISQQSVPSEMQPFFGVTLEYFSIVVLVLFLN